MTPQEYTDLEIALNYLLFRDMGGNIYMETSINTDVLLIAKHFKIDIPEKSSPKAISQGIYEFRRTFKNNSNG